MKLFCVFKYYNYPKKINLFTCNDASDIDFFIDLSTFLYIYCAMVHETSNLLIQHPIPTVFFLR